MTPAYTKSPLPPIEVDGFVTDDQLHGWVANGHAARAGIKLSLRDGRRFVLLEAVRVLGNVDSETDPYGFTGHVDTLGAMLKRGFVMSAERIALGRRVYDVEYGWIAEPMADADRSGVNPTVR